jgi:hypothetical protein
MSLRHFVHEFRDAFRFTSAADVKNLTSVNVSNVQDKKWCFANVKRIVREYDTLLSLFLPFPMARTFEHFDFKSADNTAQVKTRMFGLYLMMRPVHDRVCRVLDMNAEYKLRLPKASSGQNPKIYTPTKQKTKKKSSGK